MFWNRRGALSAVERGALAWSPASALGSAWLGSVRHGGTDATRQDAGRRIVSLLSVCKRLCLLKLYTIKSPLMNSLINEYSACKSLYKTLTQHIIVLYCVIVQCQKYNYLFTKIPKASFYLPPFVRVGQFHYASTVPSARQCEATSLRPGATVQCRLVRSSSSRAQLKSLRTWITPDFGLPFTADVSILQ